MLLREIFGASFSVDVKNVTLILPYINSPIFLEIIYMRPYTQSLDYKIGLINFKIQFYFK